MSTEIALYSTLSKDQAALEKHGMLLGKSGMFGFTRQEQGVTALTIMVTENMTPLTYMRKFHTMPNGAVSLKAGAALAEFEAMGGKFECLETGDGVYAKEDDRKATFKFESKSGRSIVYSYSIADAKREGLVKTDSRWTKRPGSMCRSRVYTNALPIIEPSIFFGEMDDDGPGVALDLATGAVPDASAKAKPGSVTVEQPAAVATPAAQPSKVVDAEVIPDATAVKPASSVEPKSDEPELSKQGLAPVGFVPAVYPEGHKGAGKLTAETLSEFGKIMGKQADTIIPKLEAKGWFTNGDIASIPLGRIQRVFGDQAGFLKAFAS